MKYIVIVLVGWAIFGNPTKTIANLFYKNDAAPWETVDAVYYPDKSNLLEDISKYGFESVGECRSWVYEVAAEHEDKFLKQGDYECGVGRLEGFGDLRVYRITPK